MKSKKSLVRAGAMLSLVGSIVLGSSLIGNIRALALPAEQVMQKLRSVPVFTITDGQGAPLVASVSEGGKNASVAGVFISQRDAQAFVEKLKGKDPSLAGSVRVVPVSLAEVYQLAESNKNSAEKVEFAYVPVEQQVQSALATLRQDGKQVQEFNGVPLFLATGGPEKGYLTIKRENEEVIPLFFNKEELQGMLAKFQQQQPDIASSVKIQVVNLEGVIQLMQTSNDPQVNQIMLIPPKESVDFVRSLQPAQPQQ